jgi:hypothetical protein
MNHSDRVVLAFTTVCLTLLNPLFGQGIPATLKEAASLDETGIAQIRTFISNEIQRLTDSNPDVQKGARETLVEGAKNGANEISPAYAAKYADLINGAVLNLLTGSKDIRVRLNAAIVTSRVADATKSARLEKVTLTLLDPKETEDMHLWGLKTAKGILPELVKLKSYQPLVEAMMAAVKKHPSPAVISEAYIVLTPSMPKDATPQNKALMSQIYGAVIPPLLELAKFRIASYNSGAPEDPSIDQMPFYFLTSVWSDSAYTNVQKVETMRLIGQLITHAAKQADASKSTLGLKEQYQSLIKQVAGGLYVVGDTIRDTNLATVAKRTYERAESPDTNLEKLVEPLCSVINNFTVK